jgi:hypothetical protein
MIYVLSRHTMRWGEVQTEVVGAFEVLEDAQDHACTDDATGLEWHRLDERIWWACGAVKLVAWRINAVELVRAGALVAPQLA